MTEINRRLPVSLVPGPVDPVDPVESVDSVDLVDLVELCGSSTKQLVADCCLGIQVECNASLFPFSGYKQMLFVFQAWLYLTGGRPELRRALCRGKGPRAKAGEDMIERIAEW